MTMTGRQKESKQAPANMTAKTPANTKTRRQRQMGIVPNHGGNTKPKNTTARQMASKEIG
jgi:hypothetical protein